MYGNPYYTQMQRYPQMQMNNPTMSSQQYIPPMPQPTTQVGLLGKIVDSIDVVKAMDIPLDGSISYFPLTDGTAIVSKQLQNDGTSRTIIYKPTIENKKDIVKYATFNEIEELKQELEDLRKEIKSVKKSKESKEKE